ncbi:MAG: thermostable hemolysin delta-VPH [Clostridiales bacterium]|nr:thermostable hemolysin delta-VPH [Clostridiales bacterium]
MYFNYHSKVKKVIENDIVTKIEILDEYHGISPAMVLYFSSHPPMPIREHKWDEYIALLFKEE